MLNKFLSFIREQNMLQPGDTVVCAVSGGADSVALLFACYLLKEKLDITLEAAHFNHHLRETADRDEAFVRDWCAGQGIPVRIDTEYLKLDSSMKLANAVSSGGEAKIVIQEGMVTVNGEVCTMRGKKLYPGDRFCFDGVEYVICGNEA